MPCMKRVLTFNVELVELVNGDLEVVVKVVEIPVESKTRTHNGRVGSARRRADGGAGRRWAEQSADISVALEANSPSGPPAHCKQLSWTSLRKHEQRKSYVNRWGNETSG